MAGQIHAGDSGIVFRYTIVDQDGDAVDLSGATTKQIRFTSPTGIREDITASFTTDGTDGKVEGRTYTPASNGLYHAQVYVAGVDGFTGHSSIDSFPVLSTL